MRLLIAALAILAATSARAQDVPIVPAGAGGRFERQIDAKTRSDGFGPGEVAAFRRAISPIIEQLAAMPAVNAPPAPVCHRLKSWIELINPHGVMGAEIAVMAPISFRDGRCSRMTGGGIILKVNMPGAGLDPSRANVRRDERDGDWYVLAFKPARNPRLVEYELNGDDYAIITHGRAPAFRPVSIERYLREKIEQARRDGADIVVRETETALAALSPARRLQPACMVSGYELSANPACPPERTLVEFNPAYFDRSRPTDVQLLILGTPVHRYHGEDDAKLASRTQMWKAIDRAALAARVR